MRNGTIAVVVLALLVAHGCAIPTTNERATYDRLMAEGNPAIETYNPTAAAWWNVLPGCGDAYNGQWGAFVVNFLLWPYSVAWGVPEAAVTASNQNVKETVAYYMVGLGIPYRKYGP